MSSRSKRAGTATPQPQMSGTSTPLVTGGRSASPLSPTRHSRLQEKAELQNLNDRLACYIDRVRSLETENSRLTIEVESNREIVTREVSNIKSIYENELSDARRLLDETAREKAKLEIDTKRLWEENEELKTKLDKKGKEFSVAEGNARMYEARAADLGTKFSAANNERKKLAEELLDLQKEFERVQRQLEEAKKNLEEETLSRVDLENNIQSLREELAFKDQIHSQEVNESRSRRQVEISEIDGRLSEQYEAKLQKSLQELREQYEAQMRINRDEIELLYDQKVKTLQSAANRNCSAASNAAEEVRTARTRIETLTGRVNEMENAAAALQGRIRDLEQLLDAERLRHSNDMASAEAELQRLRDEMTIQLQEYQDLMDIKVSLDLEIAAYDKLLCGEESRLNITPSTNNTATAASLSQSLRPTRATPSRRTPSRGGPGSLAGIKRKRTMVDESEDLTHSEYFVTSNAKGEVQILEADPEGKFVKLHNKGAKEIAIGGWQLLRYAGKNTTPFKFHRSVKIDAGATVTVWASDCGVTHEPPANIVMKTQKWFVADNMKTVLLNADGEEVAGAERIKRTTIAHASHHRTSASRRRSISRVDGRIINDELYHQQGVPGEANERCSLM